MRSTLDHPRRPWHGRLGRPALRRRPRRLCCHRPGPSPRRPARCRAGPRRLLRNDPRSPEAPQPPLEPHPRPGRGCWVGSTATQISKARSLRTPEEPADLVRRAARSAPVREPENGTAGFVSIAADAYILKKVIQPRATARLAGWAAPVVAAFAVLSATPVAARCLPALTVATGFARRTDADGRIALTARPAARTAA